MAEETEKEHTVCWEENQECGVPADAVKEKEVSSLVSSALRRQERGELRIDPWINQEEVLLILIRAISVEQLETKTPLQAALKFRRGIMTVWYWDKSRQGGQ